MIVPRTMASGKPRISIRAGMDSSARSNRISTPAASEKSTRMSVISASSLIWWAVISKPSSPLTALLITRPRAVKIIGAVRLQRAKTRE